MLIVNDLMSINPYVASPTMTLREVLMVMKVEGLRQIPVVNDKRNLVGIITDRDIRLVMNSPMVGEHWLDEKVLDHTQVSKCMTTNVITVTPNTPAYEAAEMISVYKFGALPVVDENNLVGIISITDFLEHFVENNRPETVIL